MSLTDTSATALEQHLRRCGYADAQLAIPFAFDNVTVPIAAFAGKPWDSWSACVAAVNSNGDSAAAAARVHGLGAPVVFACNKNGVDWWAMGAAGPTRKRPIAWANLRATIDQHSAELRPERIYSAKLRKPGATPSQLWFFDAGLMPAVERNRGQTLARLVERTIRGLHGSLAVDLTSRQAQEDVYRTVFWLLAAKVLHDKNVQNFVRIELTNVDEVFDRIGRHHGETGRFPPFGKAGRPAIDEAAHQIATCGSLADVSSESLAFVYENALIDKVAGSGREKKATATYDIRKELGIHSTPSALINHMLSQLWPLIDQIDEPDRHVFEPACGHAPFLTAAVRWLRDWGKAVDPDTQHRYLRQHLHGLEADPFAIEIAKLALLLADVPHGNRWDIQRGDMFAPSALARRAATARIFLANPPYERADFSDLGPTKRKSRRKVDEVLARTLPHLPSGAVIGVVVPQGFLRSAEARNLRRTLLTEWLLTEIAVFEDKLFEKPDQETAILLGQKTTRRRASHSLTYRRVRNPDMEAFKNRLEFSAESLVLQSTFTPHDRFGLDLPELVGVWRYLRSASKLGAFATVAKGLELDEQSIALNPSAESTKPRVGYDEVVRRAEGNYGIHELPLVTWIDFRTVEVRRAGPQPTNGVPQVLVNYARAGRDHWRLRAVLDDTGRVATRRFLVVRPLQASVRPDVLWALLNSPVANAFVACHCGSRDIPRRVIESLPVPALAESRVERLTAATADYLREVRANDHFDLGQPDYRAAADALWELDAEILRLYDLPPRLERELLDYFRGERRKGVPFEFGDYFPADFKPCIPLHEYLSDEFQQSTAGRLAERFQPATSKSALAALDRAEQLTAGK